ncbi:GntR family transcriptional regulator [Labilibaculum sp. A4]|uniref:GntR family transcriptional regulator n=1 Tax=Labilibaculum euxinus TaxID=2686357 RepID=A0A425Y5J1_9BACT|nr:FadR/GntR family transcriptional regulator [Labilibaculum euxinus]MDQ1772281.1 FadR/GntR family transcriptional regulator [Labilibaculum euxinus]MUP37094.1 GntR family transcriptional regulator [Labilibaculum euxinus]MVB06299.1 GntR family transcriptional regulator [Labilibaculum euxinus]MWN78021.1 GntR family transcriptional regulator [Labilibaculum euxinus]
MDEIFEKIGSAQTLSQKIERRIEEAIRQKKLLVGAKLPSERELCEMFAVSRTALREALRRLSARGLIEIKKGSGMYVSELKIKDAIDSLNLYYDLSFDSNLIPQIIEVRRVFEPEIARMAANNRRDKDLDLLLKNISDLEDCDPDNTQMEADIINKFHLNVAKASCNPIVIITMEPIYSLLPRMRNLIYANVDGEKDFTIKAHRTIYEAIRDKDADKAFEAMVGQINRTLEIYTQYLKK